MSDRNAILEVLQEKFTKPKAKKYEEQIYEMCSQLAKTVFEEPIEEVYKYYAYEKTGQLIESSETDIKDILDDIGSLRIGEEAFYRRKYNIKIPQREGSLIRSGIFPCLTPGCRARHTKETVFTMQQRRSRDEGMTCVVTCRICGKPYTLS